MDELKSPAENSKNNVKIFKGTAVAGKKDCPLSTKSIKRDSSKFPSMIDWRLKIQNTSLASKWEYLLENQIFTDTVFFVGEHREPVKCHSLILKMHSRDFESLLAGGKQEHEISFCSHNVFRQMIKYLYTDQLEITAEDAVEMLTLAKHYHLTALQRKCGQIVLKGINSNNAAFLLDKADTIGDKELAMKALEYIIIHAEEVLFMESFKDLKISSLEKLLKTERSLWKLDEVTLLEAVKRWAAAECARRNIDVSGCNQYDVAKPALDLIRFENFTAIQFTSHVVKCNILPPEMMLHIQSELIESESKKVKRPSSPKPVLTSGQEFLINHDVMDGIVENIEDPQISRESRDGERVYTLERYSCSVKKDWQCDDDGKYKISFSVSKPVTLIGVALYGHGSGSEGSSTNIQIEIKTFDESALLWSLNTSSVLPDGGGEFDVRFETPLTIARLQWYTIIVFVNGRVYPIGTGGKKNYVVDCGEGEDAVEFNFKNGLGVSGASHVRGQLPKLYFRLQHSAVDNSSH